MFFQEKFELENQTDEQLYVFLSDGSTKAFNMLYNRYQGKLLYFFYRMLGNDKNLAEDFLQEIFMKIIDKPYLFDTKRKFSTWIYSVAHNMCKNEYRNKAVRQTVVTEQHPDICDVIGNKHLDKDKVIEIIFNELELLDESHRTAFLLKYREGLSIEDIAVVMDLPAGTVKSRLFYTRKRLHEILSGKYAEIIENLF
jgi:RNA polymerase sigma-70 factor (ECF subfamily)